jgi:hypothetical protein
LAEGTRAGGNEPSNSKDDFKSAHKEEFVEAAEDPMNELRKCREAVRQREKQALLLRAKLQQAIAQNSEHDISPP